MYNVVYGRIIDINKNTVGAYELSYAPTSANNMKEHSSSNITEKDGDKSWIILIPRMT